MSTPLVVITRPRNRVDQSQAQYRAEGYATLAMPCFDIAAVQQPGHSLAEWLQLRPDAVVFTSVNAVQHAWQQNPDLVWPAHAVPCAIGPAVARALRKHITQTPIAEPDSADSEGMLELLDALKPSAVTLVSAPDGRTLIARHAEARGWPVKMFYVYRRQPLTFDADTLKALQAQHLHVALHFTSAAALHHWFNQMPENMHEALRSRPLVSGSARIDAAAQALGFSHRRIAASPADADMIAAQSNWPD